MRLKLYFCFWTRMTWPLISESTFSSKISSHNSWKTTQLSKMLWNNVPLTVQRIKHNDLLPEFPAAVSSLSLLKAFCRFRKYLKCIQLKRCLKSASHYLYCFDGLKSVTTVMCQRSHCEKTWGMRGADTPSVLPCSGGSEKIYIIYNKLNNP